MNLKIFFKKKINIFLLLLLIVSLWNSFNAIYFDWFIKASIISFIVIFIIFLLINKSKKETRRKRGLFIFISVVLILAIIVGNIFVNIISGCFFRSGYKIHLATNTITNKCIVTIDNCQPRQVWYHENGCDMSNDNKEEIIQKAKKDIKYNKILDYCAESCVENINDIPEAFQELRIKSYCDKIYSYALPDGIACNDLKECSYIDCVSYLIEKKESDTKKEFVCDNSQECIDIGWECELGRVPTCYTHNRYGGVVENPKCFCENINSN